jgi:hypothetical protein
MRKGAHWHMHSQMLLSFGIFSNVFPHELFLGTCSACLDNTHLATRLSLWHMMGETHRFIGRSTGRAGVYKSYWTPTDIHHVSQHLTVNCRA